jgi:pseudouridine-5'-phosphate glycosidase
VRYHGTVNLRIAPKVKMARETGRPIVALESTLLTHGLPNPQNLELAHHIEGLVQKEGAVPATIGIFRGEAVVGLDDFEVKTLVAESPAKASLWNLATLLGAKKLSAGTTVAATLQLAHLSGVRVFATGGIGGVHNNIYDESADLIALSRFPLITICSGPKSFLNARNTLERLESLGVPTIGYRSDRFAGFHVPETELQLPCRLDSPEEVSRAFNRHRSLGGAGFVVSNPVSDGLSREELQGYLNDAEQDLIASGVRAEKTTPFLLNRLAELSSGRTVKVNLRLLEENAVLAARIATSLTELTAKMPVPIGGLNYE